MNKKRAGLVFIVSLFIFVFSLAFIFAADENTSATSEAQTDSTALDLSGFDKAYSCLKKIVADKTASSFTPEELSLSLLALGYDTSSQTKLKAELDLRKDAKECWPKNACTLKETAMAALAYKHLGLDNDKILSWLMNQSSPASDLIWYLQIDTSDASTCKITYDGSAKTVKIGDDKKVSGSPGVCFSITSNNYWLEVKSSCYGKEFKISCDKDFLSSLIFKSRLSSNQINYITPNTHSQALNGETTEQVGSICLKQSGVCNYEGNLWATLAIDNKDFTNKVLPYLMTLAETNARFFPSSFLYYLTNFDEYLSEMNNKQNAKGYWRVSDDSRRYYDTALGLLAFYQRSSESEQAQKALEYLLDPKVQGLDGCWNGGNIRDNALILFSAAPKASIVSSSQTKCFSASPSYSCVSSARCNESGGNILEDYFCSGVLKCCSSSTVEESCSSKSGITCSIGEECVGGKMESAKGTTLCCVGGKCETPEEQYTCQAEGADYTCREECLDTETPDGYLTCPLEGVCCQAAAQEEPKSSTSYLWILILLILIGLLVWAILKREQLKIWLFKMKSKISKSPAPASQQRPGFPPMPPRPGMPFAPRRIIPGMPPRPGMPQRPPVQSKPYPRDKELAETLEKLKRIGK